MLYLSQFNKKRPAVKSFPAITKPDELGKLLRAMHGYEGRSVAVHAALNLLPLLAQRPRRLVKMEWNQLDLEAGTWTVAHPDFIVPLPRQAVEVLRSLYKYTGQHRYVFASHDKDRHISENRLGTALRALGYDTKKDVTPHSFRSTFVTLTQERFGPSVAAVASHHLGHPLPSNDVAASERRGLVQRWADYLDQLKSGPTNATSTSNIVQLTRVASS